MAKKTTRRSRSSTSKTVSIKKAVNGYIVETWSDDISTGPKLYVAKTKAEAKKFASSLLGK